VDGTVKRWSVDCKATVKIGDFSRGGQTRGDAQALDHDLGCKEKYTPCGIVDEDSAQLAMVFGSSYKTSDFLVDTLEAQWNWLEEQDKAEVSKLQIKMDNGPESSGRRTQFLYRMVAFADAIGKPIQLLYYPPYHRPTVSLDVISLVASSCGYYRGQIEHRVAHEFAVHVATQRGLAERTQHRHPPRAQPVAPLR